MAEGGTLPQGRAQCLEEQVAGFSEDYLAWRAAAPYAQQPADRLVLLCSMLVLLAGFNCVFAVAWRAGLLA